jgi:hypothetical protein
MLFEKLLLLSAALLASAVPTPQDEPEFHSLEGAGSPPPPYSRPPGARDPAHDKAGTAAPQATTPCSDWYELYGKDRWTYIEVQWCFRQQARDTVLTQEQRNPWYFWGGAWYTGKSHRLGWQTTGTVGGTRGFNSGRDFNDGPVRKNIYTFNTKISPGIHAVNTHYHQQGPWWGADASIDVDLRYSVSLGQ